jgi:hypothetical protein
MEEPTKRGKGRPAVAEANKKRNRAISLTDAEYERLVQLAHEAGEPGPSSFLVKKLKLS